MKTKDGREESLGKIRSSIERVVTVNEESTNDPFKDFYYTISVEPLKTIDPPFFPSFNVRSIWSNHTEM